MSIKDTLKKLNEKRADELFGFGGIKTVASKHFDELKKLQKDVKKIDRAISVDLEYQWMPDFKLKKDKEPRYIEIKIHMGKSYEMKVYLNFENGKFKSHCTMYKTEPILNNKVSNVSDPKSFAKGVYGYIEYMWKTYGEDEAKYRKDF